MTTDPSTEEPDDLLVAMLVGYAHGNGCTCEPTGIVDDNGRTRLMHEQTCPLRIWNPGGIEALAVEIQGEREALAARGKDARP